MPKTKYFQTKPGGPIHVMVRFDFVSECHINPSEAGFSAKTEKCKTCGALRSIKKVAEKPIKPTEKKPKGKICGNCKRAIIARIGELTRDAAWEKREGDRIQKWHRERAQMWMDEATDLAAFLAKL